MRRLQALLNDRRRRQRGSVLSALLIIVAFLSILIGGLLTELTDSFVVSRDFVAQVKIQATATSATELAIHQLQLDVQNGKVPTNCAQDARAAPPMTSLNGHPATVTQTCTAILPEQATSLTSGVYNVDGLHDTVAGQNRYLIADNAGLLTSYTFGQTGQRWSVALGGAPTAPPMTALDPDGSINIVVPADKTGSGCTGHCVVVLNGNGGTMPRITCNLPADTKVSARAAVEVTAGGSANFPSYVFFGDSGRLYVYDASSDGSCALLDSAPLAGGVATAPLVFPGRSTGNSVVDEVFLVVTGSSGTSLQDWHYTETNNDGGGGGGEGNGNGNNKTVGLSEVGNPLVLPGANAVGYGISSTVPSSGANLNLAVATFGRLDMARIAVRSGPSYTTSLVTSMVLPNGAVTKQAPYWCHCPGQDLIGVGGTNGFLYLFNTALTSTVYMYSGKPDGFPAITSTPMADSNGDWYFGASDGSVYDVEIPVSGVQMFKAARFGPGGSISSSPIVGACPGGLVGPCMYFGSSSNGSYFVRIGSTRVSDLRSCVSSAPGSGTCTANPRLWARVQVGPASIWGGTGVYVQGWSYYSQ
jgi:hypothetical protein